MVSLWTAKDQRPMCLIRATLVSEKWHTNAWEMVVRRTVNHVPDAWLLPAAVYALRRAGDVVAEQSAADADAEARDGSCRSAPALIVVELVGSVADVVDLHSLVGGRLGRVQPGRPPAV